MDAGKIATIELNMDSKEKKDKKQREPGKLKSFLQAYGKYVGAGAVHLHWSLSVQSHWQTGSQIVRLRPVL